MFVTLTYDDDHLPFDGSIHRSELQDFFKRVRLCLEGRKIRYYAVGEYGSIGQRPHYHALIFGLEWCQECRCCSRVHRRSGKAPVVGSDCELLERCWSFGHVHVGDVTGGSVRYVTGYLGKNHGEVDFGGREKSFSLMSKGLGLRWMVDHREDLIRDAHVKHHGRKIGLPRYYQKKLAESFGELAPWFQGLLDSVRARASLKSRADDREWLAKRYDLVYSGVGDARRYHQRSQNIASRQAKRESVL